jgi:hypothetical protein
MTLRLWTRLSVSSGKKLIYDGTGKGTVSASYGPLEDLRTMTLLGELWGTDFWNAIRFWRGYIF